jgi:hypothetical protein
LVVKVTPAPPEAIRIDPIPVPPVSVPAPTPRKNSAKRGQVVLAAHATAPCRIFKRRTLFPDESVASSFDTVKIEVPLVPAAAVVDPITLIKYDGATKPTPILLFPENVVVA